MFDKIQSTYFKRVTTGVLALFMTASSGFSYAVPVYAQEVTTAAAKRKKEEEFSSTESSTLTLRENDKKNEAEGSKTTETDGIKVTTNDSSDVQPEVKIEKPDNKKEPGRKLSSKKAQEDLKEMIQNKKYSYQDILQRIFEIDDFTFYSKLTLDEIKFLMSGTTEEKYEIAELLMYKSVYLYADYDITTEDFYSYLFQYFQFLDECNVDLKDEEIEKIEKQLLLDINIYYVGDKDMYQKDLNEYLENTTSPYNKKIQKTCSDYVKAMKAYLFALKEDRDKNKIRLSLGLKEETKTNQEEATEQMKKTSNDFNITEGSSLKTYDHRDKDGDNLGYNSGSYFYVQLVDEGGATTTGKVSVSGRSSSYGNKDSKLYGVLRDKETTWNCSLSCSPNNHNLSLNQTTVTTRKDDVKVRAKRTAGSNKGKITNETSYFIMNFSMGFTVHAHYNYSGRDYDIPSLGTPIRFNTDTYSAANNGSQTLDTTGTVHSDTPEAGGINVQINTGMFGVRTYNNYRYRGTKLTLTYKKPQRTLDVNGRLDGSDSGGTTEYGTFDVYLNGSCVANDVTDFYKTDIADGTSYEIKDIKATNGKVYNGVYSGSASGSMCGYRSVYLKFDTPTYYLDVNGELDGVWQGNLDGLGSCDVYINGTCVGDDIPDFWQAYPAGTKWEIRDIKTASGKKYRGITPGLSGTIGSSTASVVLQYTSGSTISINPNGGTYKGSTGISTINNAAPGSLWTIDAPTRPGYKFAGYKIDGSATWFGSNNGLTYSHGENVGSYSRNYYDDVDRNEKPEGGGYRTWHMWTGIDSATDNYNCISFPTYTAEAGHTYEISGEVWISERPSGGDFRLNFYHGDSSNDWKHCMWGISEGWTGKWVKFSMKRTFDTTTSDARFEIWTSDLKGLTGNVSFWLQNLKITDTTTGNDIPMTKVQMADDDVTLTARWIPLHHKLSYDAQGGSLANVTSYNPNEYKIIDNGEYFIQSGLNSSRYLHDYDCSTENGAKVCTFQGYGADAKQSIWTFERYKNTPYYYIINKYNGKALKAAGSGRDIEMSSQITADDRFLWYLSYEAEDDEQVYIVNKESNNVLEIPNGNDGDNVIIQLNEWNEASNERFKLVSSIQSNYPSREKYTDSAVYINSSEPVKKGYTFKGWNTKSDGSGTTYYPGDLYNETQDGGTVTLYAQWEVMQHDVHYDANGGSGAPADQTKTYGKDLTLSSTKPTRGGHTFLSWNTKADGTGDTYQPGATYTHDQDGGTVTMYAKWRVWKHTIHYNANSGSNAPTDQTKTYGQALSLSSSKPTRNGYTFLGWNTKADGTGTDYASGANYTHDQDGGTVTLYAQWTPWKHVLHYNKNVPTSSTSQTVSNMPVDQTKTFGQLMTISNLVPTRKGYTFAGWYTQSNGTGTKYDPGSNYAADQNGGTVNLYAKWTPWTYKIKYDKNVSSSSSSQAVNNMPEDQSKTQEINVILSDNKPTRNGYIFNGWQVNGTGMIYQPGATFSQDGDSNGATITLKAKWTPWEHTVHFDKNVPASSKSQTVSNIPSDVTKTFDQKLTLNSTKPTRKGYSFKEWNTKADGSGTSYATGGTYDQDHNGGTVTLYAIWTPWTHTVTYNKNVPSNAPSNTTAVTNLPGNQTKTYEKNLTLSTTKPSRTGYNFVEWNTQADGKGTSYKSGSVYSYDRDSNGGTVTLYAIWTPWKHTVTYNKNVPASSKSQTVNSLPGNQTKIYDQTLTLSNNTPTRTGYTFKEWNTQADGKGTSYKKGASYTYNRTSDGGTVTLYAIWTSWKHTVHYDKNVSSTSSSQTVSNMPSDQTKVYETNLVLSTSKPTRNGYIFTGWNTAANGSGTAYAAGGNYQYDRSNDGGTVTLYAQWTAWKHTVHYDKNVPSTSSSQTVNGIPADQTKTFDQKLTLSATKPTRNGYIFSGWNTKANGSGTAYAADAEYKHDQNGGTATLYAQWTPWKHTVHYNANGGDQNSVPTDQTKTFDQAMILSDKKPTRHGYNFVRWNTKADGTGTSYEVKGNYNHDQNGGTVTLYAIWTPWVHTVHYDANGGDQNSVPNDQKKTYGQSMNVATKVPTRNEYKFLGWTTGKDGSGTFYNPGDAYYHDQNGQTVTLYAKWVQLYTVKYDGNQPAIKGVTVTGSVANQTQGQDESVNLRTNNFKNDSGVYKDWSVGKDAYKYAVKNGTFRKYIHPEGYGTKHDTMQKELREYAEGMIRAQN